MEVLAPIENEVKRLIVSLFVVKKTAKFGDKLPSNRHINDPSGYFLCALVLRRKKAERTSRRTIKHIS